MASRYSVTKLLLWFQPEGKKRGRPSKVPPAESTEEPTIQPSDSTDATQVPVKMESADDTVKVWHAGQFLQSGICDSTKMYTV